MDPQPRSQASAPLAGLPKVDSTLPHYFLLPSKRICEGHDVPKFLTSRAYADIGVFVMQLNVAMCPRKEPGSAKVIRWQLDSSSAPPSEVILKLQELLQTVGAIIEEAPPQTGPRRFGNVSFRKWYETLESRVRELLRTYLPANVVNFSSKSEDISALDEIIPYFLGGFGSPQRLDYGTGHELSFLAFLGCIWKLGGFSEGYVGDGSLERSIVMGVIEPYLRVIRRLILTYTLEPAGSHGVWGLDDHSFLPYIFGSAQYCPAIEDGEAMPVEGSLPDSPNPGDVAKKNFVDRERANNMYFAAIGFINDVKTGPFWEHSPMLFDISGVRSGWGKINKGMIKMYNAEVLSKFPVVQHFPFGSLFSWEQDVNAPTPTQSAHTLSQPTAASQYTGPSTARPQPQQGTRAPWASSQHDASMVPTTAPWASATPVPPQDSTIIPSTRAPWSGGSTRGQPPLRDTNQP